jgi:hypothetical protein
MGATTLHEVVTQLTVAPIAQVSKTAVFVTLKLFRCQVLLVALQNVSV